jgi:hypothetical protein
MENVLIKKLRLLQSSQKSPHFMESKCSLSFSQELAICHPKPDEFILRIHIILHYQPLRYYFPIYNCVIQIVFFPYISPYNASCIAHSFNSSVALYSDLDIGRNVLEVSGSNTIRQRYTLAPDRTPRNEDIFRRLITWHDPYYRTVLAGSCLELKRMNQSDCLIKICLVTTQLQNRVTEMQLTF